MADIISTNPFARTALLIALFALVVGGALAVLSVVSRRTAVRGQLRTISQRGTGVGLVESLQRRRDDNWTRLVDRIERTGLSLGDTKSSELREKLLAAGFDSPSAPRVYNLIRLLLVVGLPLLLVLLSTAGGYQLSFGRLYIVGSILALAGLYIPALVVRAKADRRRQAITNGFPDSLDLMLVCVEAGLGLDGAVDRVGDELVDADALGAPL